MYSTMVPITAILRLPLLLALIFIGVTVLLSISKKHKKSKNLMQNTPDYMQTPPNPTEKQEQTPFCTNCGAVLPDPNSSFCPSCCGQIID